MADAPRLVLVTGTDTGVGKTFVTERLIRWLRARGTDAIALKPVETGWDRDSSDAARLADASGRTVEQTIWQHFARPASPRNAARAEGRALDQDEMVAWVTRAASGVDLCLVEGAGGWLVPFASDWLFRDVAARLGAPVLIVARSTLGTINHSLLTAESVGPRNRVLGVALSVLPALDPQVAHSNRDEIQERIDAPVLVFPEELDRLGTLFHVELTRDGTR